MAIKALESQALIYLGDEIGMLNDYGYERDADKVGDARWLHRAAFERQDW